MVNKLSFSKTLIHRKRAKRGCLWWMVGVMCQTVTPQTQVGVNIGKKSSFIKLRERLWFCLMELNTLSVKFFSIKPEHNLSLTLNIPEPNHNKFNNAVVGQT